MKLMIIGVFGHAGRAIFKEAQRRGHTVTGVAHRKHAHPLVANLLIKDIRDLTATDVLGMDAVIDAVGAWNPKTESVHSEGLAHVTALLKGSQTRYLKVGGANTLYTDEKHRHQLQDWHNYYPRFMQDLCQAHNLGLQILKSSHGVNWTYVTPPYNFDPDGTMTRHYHVDGDLYLPTDDPNDGTNDYISYADYAKGMIDIVENHQYPNQQITLYSGNNPVPTRRY
ncbi:NAD(P)-dependent oxidoreductase [Secundilactobacillus similis]|uniref:NAD(P)-binding domain-containing protein n=1 Tax=Secundilactobacillus similis DSM 23365 = JCM 2765 TaxID=1423804 RepID=A0A0R2F7B3_9LACO|nr:NAD(P)H-binding protein [Secundilactobacillus similis]KRN21178.1 hypothetical protein FD14_GL001302 [Secundilactobacillus similis DSM 23365 = JCM 2765]